MSHPIFNPQATVFIVDDDASVLSGLSRLVRSAGLNVHTFSSAEAFFKTATFSSNQPICLLVDLQMPDMGGLEVQSRLRHHPSQCAIIFISGNGDIPSTVQAMKHGAVTFLQKPCDATALLQAIHEALQKHEQVILNRNRVGDVRKRIASLSDRELEVMTWVITGALNKQIACELDIVEKTVKVHRARVLEKMRVSSVAELVRLCDLVGIKPAVPSP